MISEHTYTTMSSPVGKLLLVARGEILRGLHFESPRWAPDLGSASRCDDGPLRAVVTRLKAYFEGDRRPMDVPIEFEGTPFQKRVWDALCAIPIGTTTSYAELARRVDAPRAIRAVGGAVGRNPIAIIVPCHRVIGSNGSLTGFGGGLERKRTLLELEGAEAGVNRSRQLTFVS